MKTEAQLCTKTLRKEKVRDKKTGTCKKSTRRETKRKGNPRNFYQVSVVFIALSLTNTVYSATNEGAHLMVLRWVSHQTLHNVYVEDLDILHWLVLMRLNVLDAVNDIQALDTATENGVLVVKPWLFFTLASRMY